MAKAKRAHPGIGHNGPPPSHADIRKAMAIDLIFEEKEKALREEKKRAMKRVEGMGVRKDDLIFIKSLKDKTGTEMVEAFKRHWHLAGAIYEEQHEQLDIFAPKPSAPEVRAANFTMGLMKGLKGEELEISPAIVGDDRQQMINGFNEGKAKREAARLEVLGEALQNAEEGKVTNGTGKAADVNKQAAGDFAKDQGEDPLVVGGIRYPNMRQANAARARATKEAGDPSQDDGRRAKFWDDYPEDNGTWTDEQKDAFCNWFDALPEGPDPIEIEHPGAAAEFVRLRDANIPVKTDERPDDADPGEQAGGFLNDTTTAVVGDDIQPPAPAAEPEKPAPVAPPKRAVARPDFHAWDEDWEKWSGPQTMEFRRWFESLGRDVIPAITHPGAVTYFTLLKEERDNREAAGPSEEEQAAEPARQAATPPDEAEIAAGVAKLQESGFVPPKRGRGRQAKAQK